MTPGSTGAGAGAAAGTGWRDLTESGAPERFRAHFEVVEPRVLAFVEEPDRFARIEREVAARRSASRRGPLHGVPLGVKDVFHAAGLPTRAGSRLPPEELAGREAVSVTRLRDAGAVLVGKTATTELAWFAPAPTRNPHRPEHTPGGSSSGSAAAVAAGLCTLALGTQTIGSVGRPAAFCGVVGFKPSRERIPREGVVPLSPSLDHVGVLAPDVAWARRAAAVLCDGWRGEGAAPEARAGAPSSGRTVLAVPEGPYLERCETAALDHFRDTCRDLGAAGFEIRPVPALGDFRALEERHRRLVAAEAAAAHGERYRRHASLFRPATAELIETGRRVSAATRRADRAGRAALREELEAALARAGAELWLAPGAPGPAPRGLDGTGDPALNLPWTHAGMPAVVLPSGWLGGLPVGLQLAGRFAADEALLGVAARVEGVLAGATAGAAP